MKYKNSRHFYRPSALVICKMQFSPYASKYAHSYYPSALSPRTRACVESPSESWACDFCEIASFRTYEEAYRHERNCPMNRNAISPSRDDGNKNQDERLHMPLAMPGDKDSLSDRQCYVRSHFVETFPADEEDVSARHSKGAQKLHAGQIGIRCKHCTGIAPKNRAERAVCYPSSISRIYQTVADMQRFHFEVCTSIPMEMKSLYRSLKTTRPRGMGSPQSYWISSAKKLGLIDTSQGIQFVLQNTDLRDSATPKSSLVQDCRTSSEYSSPRSPIITALTVSPSPSSPPSSPASQSTVQSSLPPEEAKVSESEIPSRDLEANMLLALRNAQTYPPKDKSAGIN